MPISSLGEPSRWVCERTSYSQTTARALLGGDGRRDLHALAATAPSKAARRDEGENFSCGEVVRQAARMESRPFSVTAPLAHGAQAAAAATLAGCGSPLGFVYVVTFPTPQILAFAIVDDKGALKSVSGSPFGTGRGAVEVVASPSGRMLLVGHHGDGAAGSIAAFGVERGRARLPPRRGRGAAHRSRILPCSPAALAPCTSPCRAGSSTRWLPARSTRLANFTGAAGLGARIPRGRDHGRSQGAALGAPAREAGGPRRRGAATMKPAEP